MKIGYFAPFIYAVTSIHFLDECGLLFRGIEVLHIYIINIIITLCLCLVGDIIDEKLEKFTNHLNN